MSHQNSQFSGFIKAFNKTFVEELQSISLKGGWLVSLIGVGICFVVVATLSYYNTYSLKLIQADGYTAEAGLKQLAHNAWWLASSILLLLFSLPFIAKVLIAICKGCIDGFITVKPLVNESVSIGIPEDGTPSTEVPTAATHLSESTKEDSDNTQTADSSTTELSEQGEKGLETALDPPSLLGKHTRKDTHGMALPITINNSLTLLMRKGFYDKSPVNPLEDGGYQNFIIGLEKGPWTITELGQIALILYRCKEYDSLRFQDFRPFMIAFCKELGRQEDCPESPDANSYRYIPENGRIYLAFPSLIKKYKQMVTTNETEDYLAFTKEELKQKRRLNKESSQTHSSG